MTGRVVHHFIHLLSEKVKRNKLCQVYLFLVMSGRRDSFGHSFFTNQPSGLAEVGLY
jgi:hypothetical protein